MTDARPAPTGRRDIRRAATETGKLQPIRFDRVVNDFLAGLIGRGLECEQAAQQARMRLKRARSLMTHPDFRREYERRLQVLRDNERARNIHYAIRTRDADELDSPAGRKVRLDAAKWLHGEDGSGSSATRVNVSVTNQVIGYVIDLSGEKEAPRVIEAIDVNQGLTEHDE